MEQRPISAHPLDNGLRLEILDESRQIAADRWVVRIRFKVAVPVADHYTAVPPDGIPPLPELIEQLGSITTFDVVKERNFISIDEKDAVAEGIVTTFLNDVAPYLGRSSFPGKFILKTYREKRT